LICPVVQTSDSAIVAFMRWLSTPRGSKMSRVRFVGACMAAALLALSSQHATAQGSLTTEPFDGLMAPHPLGPLQKFGDWSPGSELKFTSAERASLPRPRQAHARDGQAQAQRRLNPAPQSRQTAFRSPARLHEWHRAVAGSGSVLSLAPINQERLAARQFCFPSSTIHFQQNERDYCNGGAPAYRGRFEELLGK
jgi:hypothetical protein